MLTDIQKANLRFKFIGLFKIRLIGFIGAKLVQYDQEKTVIRIPLTRRTRNHLGSMYFGALATGADVTGAWIAFDHLAKTKAPVNIVFKDMQAQFLKRADGDVYFTCTDGRSIVTAFDETIKDGERKNIPVKVVATVPDKYKDEPVAEFTLTLSMRCRKSQ